MEISVKEHRLKLTHLDKIYWPDEQITKGDLLRYYREIAPVILPHLRNRPQALLRHPEGIRGENFFQREMERDTPDWVETVKIHSRGCERECLLCQDEAALLYMANLGCIEINPWNSRVHALDNPDYLIIEFHAGEAAPEKVIEAALSLRRTLEILEIESVCKTADGAGLQAYIPLGGRYTHEQAEPLAEILVGLVHQKLPHDTCLERLPSKRGGRVYLDVSQNRRGGAAPAAYSVLALPGAPVSTPLAWPEIQPGMLREFDFAAIQKRLDRAGDLWKPILGKGINLEPCLERADLEYERRHANSVEKTGLTKEDVKKAGRAKKDAARKLMEQHRQDKSPRAKQ